jgi:hypothetical protein
MARQTGMEFFDSPEFLKLLRTLIYCLATAIDRLRNYRSLAIIA